MVTKRSKAKILDDPMAVTSSGRLVTNLDYLLDGKTLDKLVEHLHDTTGEVFLGVVIPESKFAKVMKRLDDSAAEAAATVGPELLRRRKRR